MPEFMQVPVEEIHSKVISFSESDEGKIQEIMDSINGGVPLLHALTVCKTDSGYLLVSGKKRLEAVKRLGWKEVECLVLSGEEEEDPDRQLIISLHENLKRSNLPWYEAVVLERELHDLRQKQHGAGKQGKKVGWSLRDTARELDMALGTLSEDLRLADAVLADPSFKKLGDKVTAKRVIFAEYKRQRAELEASSTPNVEFDTVFFGESSVVLSQYPDCVFDACITDPPWIKFARDETLTKDEDTLEVFKQVFRVLKYDSFLYAFVSIQDFFVYQKEFPRIGFKVQELPLIWIKENHLSHGRRDWEYNRSIEFILLAVKGTPALAVENPSICFSCPIVPPARMIHPNEKPPQVIKNILNHCSFEGSLVLDPFAGSGVVLSTCAEMGRHYVGIEREKKYYDGILRRLKNEDND